MSPALAGGFLTTRPPGKSWIYFLNDKTCLTCCEIALLLYELLLKLFLFRKGLCDDFLCTQKYVTVGILSVSPTTEQGHHLVCGLSGFD